MLRVIVVALLVANIGMFGYGWFASRASAEAGALRAPELEPERIKILPRDDPKVLSMREKPRACIDWIAFGQADAARAQRAVDGLGAGLKAPERRPEAGPPSYWVYVPAFPNRRAADVFVAELRRVGVTDFQIVQDDARNLNAVSLGVYSTEAGAVARREQLLKVLNRDVQVQVQSRETVSGRVILRVRDVPASVMTRLVAISADFPGTELRDCPPGG